MKKFLFLVTFSVILLAACATAPVKTDLEELRRQVEATERAFAQTMADRDHEAFKSFLAEETIFVAAAGSLRGKEEVAEHWHRYYQEKAAPFSWEPETVEVLDSGNLALSSGPVRNAKGETIAIFTSIWRQEAPGRWRIIFDKGCQACGDS